MSPSLIGRQGSSAFRRFTDCSVDVARELVLLFGIGAKALPLSGCEDEAEQSLARPYRQSNRQLLAVHANSPHPSSREGHLSTNSVELKFPPIGCDPVMVLMLLRMFPSPAELSTVNPDTVHDHSKACQGHDRFSNRPFGVKRFQTIHHCSVDVAHGLVLLFEMPTERPFHHGIRRRGGTILRHDLAVRRTAGSSGHANSPHPSSREGHLSTARWSSSFLLSDVIL